LVLHWSERTAWRSCCEEQNLYLLWCLRAILKKMNPLPKWGIMARCKLMFAVRRREYRAWT
jgi:hypothetical protein